MSMQKMPGRDRIARSQKDQMHDGSRGNRTGVVSGVWTVAIEPRWQGDRQKSKAFGVDFRNV